jgi:uncharacterized protein (DUF1499 family)
LPVLYFLFLKGSTPSDFETDPDLNTPFEPCPGTPNCVIHSVKYNVSSQQLYRTANMAVETMFPHKIVCDSQSLQIDSVFRIPVFGFMDDVTILAEPAGDDKSVLHIKSASRIGRGDFGVNRRRVRRILKRIDDNY